MQREHRDAVNVRTIGRGQNEYDPVNSAVFNSDGGSLSVIGRSLIRFAWVKLNLLTSTLGCPLTAARPIPVHPTTPTVSWVFVLCFPNGGSTAFAQMLLTGQAIVSLTPRAEGQWLVSEMCAAKSRWDRSHQLDYDRIRNVWRAKALEGWNRGV